LKFEKPDQRFFQSIASQIGVLPKHCAMTGNLYEKDIIGAKQCGMFTVLFNEKQITGDYSMADKVISKMEELTDIFL
jgi:FMN phosphatase YigB (HAD superfamily)